ncbi:MAG: hypothetical protein AABY00_03550 [Nanoarchaeota archaeon]
MGDTYPQALAPDSSMQFHDLEEKQRLLKDRLLLIGKSLIEEKEKNSKDIQEVKRDIIILKEDYLRIKELLQRIAEQLTTLARKEELAIFQRQLNLFRKT